MGEGGAVMAQAGVSPFGPERNRCRRRPYAFSAAPPIRDPEKRGPSGPLFEGPCGRGPAPPPRSARKRPCGRPPILRDERREVKS